MKNIGGIIRIAGGAAACAAAIWVAGCSQNTKSGGAVEAMQKAETAPQTDKIADSGTPGDKGFSNNGSKPSVVQPVSKGSKPQSGKNGKQPKIAPMKWGTDIDKALAQAKKSGKLVFIDFYADWCVPCKMLDLKVYSNPKVVQASHDFELVKIDIMKQPKVAQQYQINPLPTLMFLNEKGEQVFKQEGVANYMYQQPETFTELFDQAHTNAGATGT